MGSQRLVMRLHLSDRMRRNGNDLLAQRLQQVNNKF
jgi:hypothetical protein